MTTTEKSTIARIKTPLSQFEYRKDLADHLQKSVSDKGWLTLLLQNVETKSITTDTNRAEIKGRKDFTKGRFTETKRRFNFLQWRSNAIMLAENMPTTCFNFDKSPGFCTQPKVLFAIFKHTP